MEEFLVIEKNFYGLYDIEYLLEGQIAYLYRTPTEKYLGMYKFITGMETKWFFTADTHFLKFPDPKFLVYPKFIGWSSYNVKNSLIKKNSIDYLTDVFID
tara:strand:- start:1216 stop:1515 length:300 start_codon:yes stop_codon:yes gene_type:complete